ncbi:hypothetical protein QBC46DRAFT_399805 [Diplogelasinospora grovesii]|uniref:Uncharacterized protein n=1 Tax=Diplogelasinospora grovesii TaxID=303347 RepID=A0AAN6RZ34_9PEZI|nr:hypothetical protein QBC46DRAFT_399805 [Diplogelasinospora grovesii]
MTYSVPAGAFHSTQPAADLLYATFFYFDSSRGFDPDARVLGPSDGESFTQHRDPAGVTAPSLVRMVQAVRSWAAFLEEGRRLAKEAKWESALHAFDRARSQASQLPDAAHYRRLVLAELGNANRRFGRYQRASEILEALIAEVGMEDSPLGIEVAGELGVIYRHMNRLIDARRVLQGQYDAAARLGRDREACRALGNLGMVNYQLFLRQSSGSPGDDRSDSRQDLLSVAVEQLTRRVEMARRMREALDNNDDDTRAANAPLDARTRALFRRDTLTWESVGLARLSLCRAAHGDTGGAVEAAKEALRLQEEDEGDLAPVDPNVLALGRFFYGRALWADGQTAAARAQLDPPYDAGYRPAVCTPAIALCKEPSEEHSGYLRELVAAGVDMDRIDDAGYSALDYAVFGGDKETQDVVLEGLGKTMDEKAVRRRLEESRLRKAYRELYQERLREVLLKGGALQQGARHETVQELRHVYATALGEDQDKAGKFDVLKYVPYPEFEALGRLPRSTDGLARPFTPRMPASESDGASSKGDVFIIFFSYRWLGRNSNGQALPDDTNHTQYRRMMRATDGFLALHPELDKQGLGVWLDYACVDQDDPARGVAALPMLLAQCDAVISLHDDLYYTRAWCSVETLMVQTLKKSYGLPLWYEEIPKGEEGDDGSNIRGTLRHGPMDMKISLAEKHITFESDRPKVLFLERQTRLLG